MQKYLELKHHTLILLISKANPSHSEIIHSSRNRRDGVFRDNTNPRALKLCTKISVEDTNLESSHTFRPTLLYNLPLNLPLLPLFITSPTLFPISPVNSYSLHTSCWDLHGENDLGMQLGMNNKMMWCVVVCGVWCFPFMLLLRFSFLF